MSGRSTAASSRSRRYRSMTAVMAADKTTLTPLHCAGRDTDTNSERTWAGCPPG